MPLTRVWMVVKWDINPSFRLVLIELGIPRMTPVDRNWCIWTDFTYRMCVIVATAPDNEGYIWLLDRPRPGLST